MSALTAVQGRPSVQGRAAKGAPAAGADDFGALLSAAGAVTPTPTAALVSTPAGTATVAPAADTGAVAVTPAAGLSAPGLPTAAADDAVAPPALVVADHDPAAPADTPPTAVPLSPAPPADRSAPDRPRLPSAPVTASAVPVVATSAAGPAEGPVAELDPLALPSRSGAAERSARLPLLVVPDPVAAPSTAPSSEAAPAPPPLAGALVEPVAAEVSAPLVPTTPRPAPEAGAPAAPATARSAVDPPSTQVVAGLAPVLDGPDGAYTMSLQLYPEELGSVQVEISLRNGEISLAMLAVDVDAVEVLRAALPDLRTELESTGLTSTGVSVDLGRGDETPHRKQDAGAGTRTGDARSETAADEPATSLSGSDATLDVRI